MSNTVNSANLANTANLYEQIVEIKKKQMELLFTPSQNRAQDHPTQMRVLRSNLAKLQRAMVAVRVGKQVEMPAITELMPAKKTKRGKK